MNGFSTDDITILQTLADQIAVAVDNARSYELTQRAVEETRQRVQELSVLFNVSQALASAKMEDEEIANIIARRFVEVMNFPQCSISLIDPDSEGLRIFADLSKPPDNLLSDELTHTERVGEVCSLNEYPAATRAMQTLLPQIIQSGDPNGNPLDIERMNQSGLATLVIIPLAVKGQAIGTIELRGWDYPRNLSSDQLNLAMILANAAAVALENAQLYGEQRRTTEKLREVDRIKSQFLANMSHELRTPLNSIIGFSRVIIKGIDGPTTELQLQDLNAIYSAGQHLLKLINDILDISKIEAGKMELSFDNNVSLDDLITSVLSTATGLVKDKPITLHKVIPEDLPLVTADATRLRQVVLNLLSNAAKFTDSGSITVEAAAQISTEGHPEVIVKVVDTGTGITPVDQKKLFQPFSQVDDSPTRKTGGTGLGLSICRRLVEMHGGRIGVISDVGKGSVFYFTLPLPLPEPEAAIRTGNKRILSIDDERSVLNLYDRYLAEHGYLVVPLTDPNQAVSRAKEVKPFAITLDVMMPERNGWQVLEDLKKDSDTRNIPVILCTILEDQEKAFSLGAADYLMKPILEEDLLNSLSRLNGNDNIHELLIIDEDKDDIHWMEKIIQKDNRYQVSLALGGANGLAQLRTLKPQAVILDLFMAGIDGFTILEVMRADPVMRDIPVIIVTSEDLTEEQKQRLSQFSLDMLHKGIFKEKDLLTSIEKALHRFDPPDRVEMNYQQ